ncbi:MAG: chloride channel protein [Draconibacterium sp.]|nr:MAG: chloride channel protein [Draconibacterium sp.]
MFKYKWLTHSQRMINQLIVWRLKRISDRNFLYVLSLLIGFLSGLAALILKNLVHFVGKQLITLFSVNGISYLYLIYPLIGILLTVLFVRFFVKDDISHGVSKILYAISRKSSRLKPHNIYSSMVASSLTIGLGGSVGAEAPIVLTGASIGSNLAQFFKLNYKYVTLMVGCGTAGAIAGIFNAPVAGIVFTLEVIMIDLTMAYLVPLLISAITATVMSYFFMGDEVLVQFLSVTPFQIKNILFYILLGVFAGFLGLYFTHATMSMEKKIGSIKNWIVKVVVGGFILGILVFIFPPLRGEGYTSIIAIFNGQGIDLLNNSIFSGFKNSDVIVLAVLAGILLFKVPAMVATTASGGVGGVFAPTLFLGAVAGFFMARFTNTFFGFGLPEDNFALAGMAGMMAAVMHAPLTGIFLTAELTKGYDLFVPLLITSTVAYVTIMWFEPHSIYTKRLAQRGELITHHKDKAVLQFMQVRKLIESDFEKLSPEASLGDLVKAISTSDRNLFPVVGEADQLLGMVKLADVRKIIFETDLYDQIKVKDLMYMPEYFISPDDTMEKVAEKFESSGRYNLAVIDDGQYLGFISRAAVFSKYRKTLQQFSNE